MPHLAGEAGARMCLPIAVGVTILPGMFVVSEAEATAIRAAFDHGGELRRRGRAAPPVPRCDRQRTGTGMRATIAGWEPLPVKPRLVRLPGKRP